MLRPLTSPAAHMPGTEVRPHSVTFIAPRSVRTPTLSRPMPAVLARLPVLTSTASQSRPCTSSPSLYSRCPAPYLPLTFETPAPRMNFMPFFSRFFLRISEISRSVGPAILSSISITVTSEPTVLKYDAVSRPITPPPITHRCFGTTLRSRISRFVIASPSETASLSPGIGGTEASLPVQIRRRRAV